MQIFYLKNIKSDFLEGQEYNHCYNVLRKKVRDKIKLTDGKGNLYSAEIKEIKNRKKLYIVLGERRGYGGSGKSSPILSMP